MRRHTDYPLSELTTLGLGGPAAELIEVESADELTEVVAESDEAGSRLLVVAGGSNLVVADAGWDARAVAVRTHGVEVLEAGERRRVRVAAGESWDGFVERTIEERLAGIECLSGIPGSTGATPVQNVGAYGQEVAGTIRSVRAWDRRTGEVVELSPAECRFSYRSSAFKGNDRWIVIDVTFELDRSSEGHPIAYGQLADALGVEIGERAPLAAVREAVLELRRGKGMVIDPADPDSRSAGSFFTNPILDRGAYATLREAAAARLGPREEPPAWPEPDGRVKTSAAWLIQRTGFERGYGDGAAGVSGKHPLALVNRGGATTAELIELARELRDGVREHFGVDLVPEPTLVGVAL
ncbi:MAG TPA: UDP-N-acetylmuramate dehydrogenase [Solirubrobacterales bacterium]|nr:UDP-N-acetylmuramate dehydrogenase [Solirubrobacterales bacterium]